MPTSTHPPQNRRTSQAFTASGQPAPRSWVYASALAAFLLTLPLLLPADGHPHGNFEQFLGRFHPAAVHLPIALLLLIPILEVAGRSRPALREAAAFILPCAALCTLGSVLLGVLLAHGGGFAYQAVRVHMFSGILLALLVLLCTLVRPAWQAGTTSWLYPASLAAVVLLTLWTGHQGGAITYGTGYLTRFAPIPHLHSRRSYPPVDPASVYATRIQPIFNARCLSCHNSARRKGGLELDSYAHAMDGGSSGQVIVEGDPERSILYNRVTLPPTDRKFMPSEGKPPLTSEELSLLRNWIQQGASPLAGPPSGPAPQPTAHNSINK